jgi:hypothetical protein
MLDMFRKQAEQKIEIEGWAKQGRNVHIKVQNFVQCWTTEEAFKQLLIERHIWFRNRGLYFGDAQGAGADFIVKINGREVSIGLRSISTDSLMRWKSVAYPDDRFRHEQEKIADYHVVCHYENGNVKFFGIISKEKLLNSLQLSPRLYSRKNQEYFRVVPLDYFAFDDLLALLEQMENS